MSLKKIVKKGLLLTMIGAMALGLVLVAIIRKVKQVP